MRLRHTAGLSLQVVITDLASRVQRLFDIARLKQTVDIVRPDPREAIGLKLQPHGQSVRLSLAGLLAGGMDLFKDTQLVLDVVGHLMRNHIGRRKIPPRAKLARQGRKEFGIEIGLLIARAVERLAPPQGDAVWPENSTMTGGV